MRPTNLRLGVTFFCGALAISTARLKGDVAVCATPDNDSIGSGTIDLTSGASTAAGGATDLAAASNLNQQAVNSIASQYRDFNTIFSSANPTLYSVSSVSDATAEIGWAGVGASPMILTENLDTQYVATEMGTSGPALGGLVLEAGDTDATISSTAYNMDSSGSSAAPIVAEAALAGDASGVDLGLPKVPKTAEVGLALGAVALFAIRRSLKKAEAA